MKATKAKVVRLHNEEYIAMEYWCMWNVKEITSEQFNKIAGSPHYFKKVYWGKGLKEYWIKFTKRGRK